MLYGYARVSSKEQSLKRQIKELEEKGVDKKNIFKEFGTGKSFQNRIEYQKLLDKCKVGDTIYFTSLDRFSRNVRETVKQLEILENRGLKAVFLKESISTEMKGVAQLIISIFSWVAEQERLTLLERQRQGYNALKKDENGRLLSKKGTVIGGKEKILTIQQINILKDYKLGKSIYNISQIARLLEVSRPFIYKKLKELETAN
jgi:DNA invertase Pin-like site-specific DNA recombinase